MGQRQNQSDIVYGEDCLAGFDAGKTPKYVYARFADVVKCTIGVVPEPPIPPNDKAFKLTQTEGNACLWTYFSDVWNIWFEVLADPLRTTLALYFSDYIYFYFGDLADVPPEEGFIYANDIDTCDTGAGAKDGIAVVTWRLLSLTVLGLINIETANDLFLELFPVVGDHLIFKYCKLQDGTNVKILYEI